MQPIPGLVDLQVNGYINVNFTDPALTLDEAARACRALVAAGTSVFLPTIVTTAPETFAHALPILAELCALPEFAGRLPGIHVEGPFLSPEPGAVGAHPPQHVHAPDLAYFDRLQEWAGGRLTLLTIAADQPGADALCRHAVASGVTVSLGHHLASADDLARLADAGATLLTHVGNGLPNMLPRLRNPLTAALACDALIGMFITDGHHLPDAVIRMGLRSKGIARSIVVSDQMSLAGMPPGEYYVMENRAVLEPSGLLHNPDKQCLVGSAQVMVECMNYLAGIEALSLAELLQVGYYNPLQAIGLQPTDVAGEDDLCWDEATRKFSLRTE